jgi:hypothetical protein
LLMMKVLVELGYMSNCGQNYQRIVRRAIPQWGIL